MKEQIYTYIVDRLKSKATDLGAEDLEVDGSTSLTMTGLLDSMDFFGLITDIEEAFSVTIDFSEVDPEVFTSIDGLVSCVKNAEQLE